MKKNVLIFALLILFVLIGCANKSAVENSFKESPFINLNNKNENSVNTINIKKTDNNIDTESLNNKNLQNQNTDSDAGEITLKQPEIKIEDNSVVKDEDDKEFNFKIGKINKKKINTKKIKLNKINKIKKIDILNK